MPQEHRRGIVSQQMRTIFRFRNGSQITVLPNSENQLRGFTAHLIVIDEAAFFHNDEAIFRNILPPMLATTGGTLIVSSTPWGKNTVFYQLNQDPDYEKHVVTWREAAGEGRYSQEFLKQLEKERDTRPQVFKMEYEAEFIEEVDTWLTQDLLAKSCSDELQLLTFESQPTSVIEPGSRPHPISKHISSLICIPGCGFVGQLHLFSSSQMADAHHLVFFFRQTPVGLVQVAGIIQLPHMVLEEGG